MGLTIHYTLVSAVQRSEDARALVEKLHAFACGLSFAEVGEIIGLHGSPAYDPDDLDRDDPGTWMKIQACDVVTYQVKGEEHWAHVPPEHLIAFSVLPGQGCEPANFGLCRYPKTIVKNGKRISIKARSWRWSSFCKTQYASNPASGGLPNFLRSHVGLVKLLDYARELVPLIQVQDESGYWSNRDEPALVKQIEKWNQMVAGAVGVFKDALQRGGDDAIPLTAEITKFPDFEHLEAKGRPGKEN